MRFALRTLVLFVLLGAAMAIPTTSGAQSVNEGGYPNGLVAESGSQSTIYVRADGSRSTEAGGKRLRVPKRTAFVRVYEVTRFGPPDAPERACWVPRWFETLPSPMPYPLATSSPVITRFLSTAQEGQRCAPTHDSSGAGDALLGHMESFLATYELPPPSVAIPPGFAVTGVELAAYIGTTTGRQWSQVVTTPYGTVEIQLSSTYEVDWSQEAKGDEYFEPESASTSTAPVVLRTVFTTLGQRTVVVRQRWFGTWTEVGGTRRGVFTDNLVTETVVVLPVIEIEAVRVTP